MYWDSGRIYPAPEKRADTRLGWDIRALFAMLVMKHRDVVAAPGEISVILTFDGCRRSLAAYLGIALPQVIRRREIEIAKLVPGGGFCGPDLAL